MAIDTIFIVAQYKRLSTIAYVLPMCWSTIRRTKKEEMFCGSESISNCLLLFIYILYVLRSLDYFETICSSLSTGFNTIKWVLKTVMVGNRSENTTFFLLSETSLVKMSRFKDLPVIKDLTASLTRKKNIFRFLLLNQCNKWMSISIIKSNPCWLTSWLQYKC